LLLLASLSSISTSIYSFLYLNFISLHSTTSQFVSLSSSYYPALPSKKPSSRKKRPSLNFLYSIMPSPRLLQFPFREFGQNPLTLFLSCRISDNPRIIEIHLIFSQCSLSQIILLSRNHLPLYIKTKCTKHYPLRVCLHPNPPLAYRLPPIAPAARAG